MENVRFTYENIAMDSYLVAVFTAAAPPVHYQLQMITANDIKNLLRASKRQSNDEILVSYNISSHISLKQVLTRKKMKMEEFLELIQGTIAAWKEVTEYQLVTSGIMLDQDYIYLRSGLFVPDFVYLPVERKERGLEGLKDFIKDLIIGGRIETVQDNTIQILLNTLQQEDLDIRLLEECVTKLQNRGKETHKAAPQMPPAPQIPPASQIPPTPVKKEVLPEEWKHAPQSIPLKQEIPEKKQKFLLLQAPVIIALAAGISFGFFGNLSAGGLYPKNILAALLVAGAVEFIGYREIFVNGKEEKKKKTGKVKKQKQSKKTETVPQEARREPIRPEKPAVLPAPPLPNIPQKQKEEPECDETSIMEAFAFLEYYQDREVIREPLEGRTSVLIGRLAGQVDLALHSSKVGKLHAELICQDGQWYVRDLNSRNGTYLNGDKTRITSNTLYPLADGDRITLADCDFIFHEQE